MRTIPLQTVEWLTDSEYPRVRYGARRLFLREMPERDLLYEDPLILRILASLTDWNEEILKQHNKPELAMHRLCLLADLGVSAADPEAAGLLERIAGNLDSSGLPRINVLIPKMFRGTGKVEREWIICDYPQILYGLLRMGAPERLTGPALEYLSGLSLPGGYPCVSSMEGFRGPGPKTDFCPIASLYALKALNLDPSARVSAGAARAAESLLNHWENREKCKHYLFGIGTDFQKLKYPLIWYNLLHVLDVLSLSEAGKDDPRTEEMAGVLLSRADEELRFTPGSMYRYYGEEDFADKKRPSPTLTLKALEILLRLNLVTVE